MHYVRAAIFSVIAALSVCSVGPSFAEIYRGLGQLALGDWNQKDSYSIVTDPTGLSSTEKVQSFHIEPGCTSDDDCLYKSVRSIVRQDFNAKQPKEAWYGWEMYFPRTFTTARQQPSKGYYTFLNFKSFNCPYLSIRNMQGTSKVILELNSSTGSGNNDCVSGQSFDLFDIESVRGQWVRVEMFIRWSKKEDGIVKIYINGKLAANYQGRTKSTHTEKNGANYMGYGLYLCCSQDDTAVKPTTILFTNVSRANSQDRLLK